MEKDFVIRFLEKITGEELVFEMTDLQAISNDLVGDGGVKYRNLRSYLLAPIADWYYIFKLQ